MVLLAALGLSSSFAASKGPGARTAAKCGEERWPVKTLSDPRVGDVNFTPHDTSIGRLRNKPDPTHEAEHAAARRSRDHHL